MRVALQGLRKSFLGKRVIQDFTTEIDAGTINVVLGPNGAGKTTLLRCMSGLLVPNKGHVVYDGERFNRERLDTRRRLFFMPDAPIVYAHMTPIQHIGMVLRLYQKPVEGHESRIAEVLEELDLLPLIDSPLGTLSRGQIYKTCLASLAAVEPELWLVDEPFASGMDPRGLMFFKKAARSACESGATVIYSTQILDVAQAFSDRCLVVNKGEITILETRNLIGRAEGNALEELFASLR